MASEHEERFPNYLLVWGILLLLTCSSIAFSFLVKDLVPELRTLLLVFLFLVGAIKTSLVALNFMHLRFEKRILWALGCLALLFVGFFVAGALTDITSTVKR